MILFKGKQRKAVVRARYLIRRIVTVICLVGYNVNFNIFSYTQLASAFLYVLPFQGWFEAFQLRKLLSQGEKKALIHIT